MQQVAAARLSRGFERLVLAPLARDRPLVGEHDVHPGCECGRERLGRVVRGDVHQDRVRDRVAGNEPDRVRRGPALATTLLGERHALRLGGAERGEPLRRQAPRVEHKTAAVDHAHDTEPHRVLLGLRQERRERPADLSEAQQHHVRPFRMPHHPAADLRQLEGGVDHALGGARVLSVHHEREVELGRSLRDGDDVDPGVRQGGEDPRGDPRRAGHPYPHDHERRRARAELDPVDLLTGDLVPEGLEQARPCPTASRLTPIKVVGLCHGVFMGRHQIASILEMREEDLETTACGINHFTWFQTIRASTGSPTATLTR